MVPDFLYSNRYHFFNIIIIFILILIIIITIIIFLLLTAKLPSQLFFNISKQNLIDNLFHRGDFVKDRK